MGNDQQGSSTVNIGYTERRKYKRIGWVSDLCIGTCDKKGTMPKKPSGYK
jgi:hypothetical protein